MVVSRLTYGTALAVLLLTARAHAEPAASWPRITQAKDAKACRQALVIARLAFNSTAARPADAAPDILREKKPDFGILLAPDVHNADGDEMIVDESGVRQENGGAFKAVFLQKAPADGFRLVVTQQKMNWQGDFFGLHLVDAALDADKTAELLAAEKKADGNSTFKTAFKNSWQRPWLVRDPDSQRVVGIDTQHPAEFLADWIVYQSAAGDLARACHIAFRPPAKNASDLLPAGALRELAALLDSILGVPAQSEGTLNPTGRIRVAAARAWANAALRPWAMEEPYNSPSEIANGLAEWTKRSPAYQAQHRRMQALLPKALSDLAAYYRKALGKTAQEAAALAKQALDRAVGAHFVFPKKGE